MADEAKAGGTAPEESGSAGGSRTWLWMILSLVVVGGFLIWLGMASEPTAVAVAEEEEEDVTEQDRTDGVTVVERDTLAENKAAYEGQRIRVTDLDATSALGPAIFWGELGDQANQVPILVRLDSAAAEGWELRSGARYSVTGQLLRMTDSVAADWTEQGEFRGEGEAMQATFTDYFIQASRIRPVRGESADRDRDDDDGSATNGG